MKPPRRADRTPASAARCTAVAAAAFPRSYVDARPRARGRRARVRGLPGCGYVLDVVVDVLYICRAAHRSPVHVAHVIPRQIGLCYVPTVYEKVKVTHALLSVSRHRLYL
jgi:hypothetical protein